MTSNSKHTNRLIETTSPYLLQHAHNPVNWYPWGEEALTLAREQNKPILLSIGYSACHWCHVMAHESFEHDATADVMNQRFINIKVDREERPDLDKIYQNAHHLLAQRAGGWPLTMFLTPDNQTPFFGGTYFPDKARHGLPSFVEIMEKVDGFYHEYPDKIAEQNEAVLSALRSMSPTNDSTTTQLNSTPIDAARQQLESDFDPQHGGFGSAPKFPHPTSIESLLRHWAATRSLDNDTRAKNMAYLTLVKMARGGINDHLGGGFCRYSTDDQWMIPHFEKMLYDNGPLLCLYTDAWQETHDALFSDTANSIANWVISEMQSNEGGYYSALDADSEGKEGKFYAWTQTELKQVLDDTEYEICARHYGFDQSANFEGLWHLHTFIDVTDICEELALPVESIRDHIASAKEKLFSARIQRMHPGRDDKILTSWNALMIKGMARSGRILDKVAYIQSAESALTFIHETLWVDGRLLATYKDGKTHLNAYLDDYSYLIDAILELLQAKWNTKWLQFAIELTDAMLEHFEDKQDGAFFFTSHDHESLIHRSKSLGDEAMPSGNGIAAQVLIRLGYLLGETRYLDSAEKTLKLAWPQLEQVPYAHTSLLIALEEHLYPPEIIVIRGQENKLREWLNACNSSYSPRRLAFAIPNDVQEIHSALKSKEPATSTIAYHCQGTQCGPPIQNLAKLGSL